ncbi:MAG TPA: aldo/keto reductase [Thermomicrobiales bacterium]|jgi:L-glyceraldehyde 3-phosphate reductase|nr:aldo/keto reductase [Thermomicrobiales bacterium]
MYTPSENRYDTMAYRRCGTSGLRLPALSLGLWHNFGGTSSYENMRELVQTAFDHGITHFDLANNYGPPPGSAEEAFGRILKQDLAPFRDELIISTKAGYGMWDGPYGDGGSRKYLLASLDASLARLGLPYVDVFYHHRPDPETPLEETALALDQAVRSGRALYAGISNYPADLAREMAGVMRSLGTPCLIHQPSYNIFRREPETSGLFRVLAEEGIGSIVFSPLAQGLLTARYANGVPEDSRAASDSPFLQKSAVDEKTQGRITELSRVAEARGQTLAQLALAWVLRPQEEISLAHGSTRTVQVTTALVGASRSSQIIDNVGALAAGPLTPDELTEIDRITAS